MVILTSFASVEVSGRRNFDERPACRSTNMRRLLTMTFASCSFQFRAGSPSHGSDMSSHFIRYDTDLNSLSDASGDESTSTTRTAAASASNPLKPANKKSRNRQRSSKSKKAHKNIIALDCEMVGVGEYGLDSALARVTLVDWNGGVVYDEFVKPLEPVVDYRTFVSGITEEMLNDRGLDLAEVQSRVSELLEGKVLVGHALKNDLQALSIAHPWQLTRDTAKYEPFMHIRANGRAYPRKLRDLCVEFLDREIQTYGTPHCPVEDAKAALDLYKSTKQKWELVMDYKIKKTAQILHQQQGQSPTLAE
jgi:RNA exonuclease 4